MTKSIEHQGKASIVGVGLITPLGNNVQEHWHNLINSKDGIKKKTFPEFPQIDISIAGTVEGFNPYSLVERNILSKADLRYHSSSLQFSVHAAFEALQDAGMIVPQAVQKGRMTINSWKLRDDIEPEDVCVIGATGVGGSMETGIDVHKKLTASPPQKAEVPHIFRGLPARVATVVSLAFGTRGGAYMIAAECASGNYAQGEALERIRSGRSKIVIVVGAEASISAEAINMFEINNTLSRQKDTSKAPRAFEDVNKPTFMDSMGFVMGEGGGSIVLSDPDYARSKNLKVRAYLKGYGDSSDAYHPSSPHPKGRDQLRAMQIAIADAGGFGKEGGAYINAHATGTPADEIEARVIYEIMREYMERQFGLSSTKPSHAHLLGLASIVEGIGCVLALETGILPPNIKSENPQELAMMLKLVRNEARYVRDLRYAINNGFGFGGVNAVTFYEAA